MNGDITEKNYPLKKLWLLKPILFIVFFILFLAYLEQTYFGYNFNKLSHFFYYNVYYLDANISSNEIYGYLFIYLFTISATIIHIVSRIRLHYSFEEKFLVINKTCIPYNMIQNIDIKQDLFDRALGLASFTIKIFSQEMSVSKYGYPLDETGRSEYPIRRFSISGLGKAQAEALRQIVLTRI